MATGRSGPPMGDLLEVAGRSLREAQTTLTAERGGLASQMVISDAELDLRVAVETGAKGELHVRPVGSAEARKGAIEPAALSTLKVHFIALADTEEVAGKPDRSAQEVIDEVSSREDVKALESILDGLSFEAVFIPRRGRWLVTARDAIGRTVREVVLPDGGRADG